MRFGPTPLDEAEGATLAHSVRIDGATLKKGRVLGAEDIAALRRAGLETVTTARLEPGDLGEDAAAEALARALAGDGIARSRAATGRVNLFAEAAGLARIDAAAVDAVNAVDEALTVATVPHRARVETGQVVATVKVIPFGVAAATVERAAVAGGTAPVALDPFVPRRIGLVQTRQAGGGAPKPAVLDKTVAATRARAEALGCTLEATRIVDHDEAAIAAALAEQRDAGCAIVLVIGVSAIVDRRDMVPVAVGRAGGEVVHLGMPADPGNLTLVARLGEAWVLGLPGSARSPRLHGSDWLLERLVAGIPVTGADIMAMGVGGLLKDVPGRPLPRVRAAPRREAEAGAPAPVAAVVLAAGQSRRMGRANKLLAEVGGETLIARTVDAALASRADPVVVVTGHQAEAVRAALAGRDAHLVHNPDYDQGLSTSLARGLKAVPAEAPGALVCLSDMPGIAARHLDALIAAFAPEEGCAICVPVFDGKRGNPVLWARRHFAELRAVSGDVGGRHLIGEHEDELCEVPLDAAVLTDLDTPEAVAAAGGRLPAED